MSKSVFTLTFIVEIVDVEVWHDCEEGWVDLGPCLQGTKIQYTLYPGHSFEVDILIWPHVAKVWCGNQYGWVRTWQYLQRRWFAFSIRHAIAVKVMDFLNFKATVNPTTGIGTLGSTARNDKNFEVYIPALKFGERRYFASVIDAEVPLLKFMYNLIWTPLLDHIHATCLDGVFDTPYPVSDVRHQDTVISFVQETILDKKAPELNDEEIDQKPNTVIDTKKKKEKGKINQAHQRQKFEISLTGDTILAGAGRIIPFEVYGEPSPLSGEVIALISSNNLPAYDDLPILFINVNNLANIPIAEFNKHEVHQLYLRWVLDGEVHESERLLWKGLNTVNFNYHHSLPLPVDLAAELTASFLEEPFRIDLRAVLHQKPSALKPKFFGYNKKDQSFELTVPPEPEQRPLDIIIAHTKIDCGYLAKGINGFIRGDYYLFPPRTSCATLNREYMCTNDINGIRQPMTPQIVVPSSVILESNMCVEVSVGVVGCKPRKLAESLSRLYALVYDSDLLVAILKVIAEINDKLYPTADKHTMLTGFALDVGETVFMFLEGPKDGKILVIWQMTEDDPSKIVPLFSSSARYSSRLYPDFMLAMPFNILKMYAPLGVLLACPPVYVRPALPTPARIALLKIGRIISNKLREVPSRSDMPTNTELRSFRLELCAPPRPLGVLAHSLDLLSTAGNQNQSQVSLPKTISSHRSINFDKNGNE